MPTSPNGWRSRVPPRRRSLPPRSTAWPANASSRRSCSVGDLAAFGAFSRAELAAVGALLKYVELTQLGKRPCLRAPRRTGPSNRLVIDAPTRASLELLRSLSGERQSSLLGVIDRTVTGPGARELAARLASPLRDPAGDRRPARRGRLPARATSCCARMRAPRCGPRPTSRAPCRAWPCSAAARAILPPCATACARRARA